MSYKKIMVSVDGSETSNKAALEAINLSKLLQATLCIIHVVDEFPLFYLPGAGLIESELSTQKFGETILNNFKQLADEHGVTSDVLLVKISPVGSKKVSEAIVEAVQSWKADLLVIGTHGRRGFNRIFLGSVAEETVRISTIPVLLIRAKESQ
jgi:nucleotide-binding universal stress UspA family protein